MEIDLDQPWTFSRGDPPGEPVPERTDAASNPRQVAHLYDETRVKMMRGAAVGAHGRLYFGGMGLRDYNGGGFGWYDPKSGREDGMWRLFSGHPIFWLTPALEGRYIVAATRTNEDELNGNRMSEQAKLFVYDVQQGQFVREIVPVPGADKTGPLLEVAPGRLLGLTTAPDGEGGVLYGVDVRSGEVLFNRPLPARFRFNWSHTVVQSPNFVKGPDGVVWTMLDDVLVRIDPKTTEVHIVGRVESGPAHFVFQGDDLYFAGDDQLRRLSDAAAASR